jgi:hypothetical protein
LAPNARYREPNPSSVTWPIIRVAVGILIDAVLVAVGVVAAIAGIEMVGSRWSGRDGQRRSTSRANIG